MLRAILVLTSVVLGAIATPAQAASGEVGLIGGIPAAPVVGAKAGLQLGVLPVSVHGNAWLGIGLEPIFSWAAWAQTTPLIPAGRPDLGLVGGANFAFQGGGRCVTTDDETGTLGSCKAPRPVRFFLGLAYQQAWDALWWRITPTAVLRPQEFGIPYFSSEPSEDALFDTMAAPPFLEIGIRQKNTSVSLRSALPFLACSTTF